MLMTHLVALYLLVATLVSIGQVLYFGWRLWPFLRRTGHALRCWLRRKVFCPWCWDGLHMRHRFPEQWSSTICHHHERRMLAQMAARRRARATTRPRVICVDVAGQREVEHAG